MASDERIENGRRDFLSQAQAAVQILSTTRYDFDIEPGTEAARRIHVAMDKFANPPRPSDWDTEVARSFVETTDEDATDTFRYLFGKGFSADKKELLLRSKERYEIAIRNARTSLALVAVLEKRAEGDARLADAIAALPLRWLYALNLYLKLEYPAPSFEGVAIGARTQTVTSAIEALLNHLPDPHLANPEGEIEEAARTRILDLVEVAVANVPLDSAEAAISDEQRLIDHVAKSLDAQEREAIQSLYRDDFTEMTRRQACAVVAGIESRADLNLMTLHQGEPVVTVVGRDLAEAVIFMGRSPKLADDPSTHLDAAAAYLGAAMDAAELTGDAVYDSLYREIESVIRMTRSLNGRDGQNIDDIDALAHTIERIVPLEKGRGGAFQGRPTFEPSEELSRIQGFVLSALESVRAHRRWRVSENGDAGSGDLQDIGRRVRTSAPAQQVGPIQFDIVDDILRVAPQRNAPDELTASAAVSARRALVTLGAMIVQDVAGSNLHHRLKSVVNEIQAKLEADADLVELGVLNLASQYLQTEFADEISPAIAAMLRGWADGIRLLVGNYEIWGSFNEAADERELTRKDVSLIVATAVATIEKLEQAERVEPEVPRTIALLRSLIADPGSASKRIAFALLRTLENLTSRVMHHIGAILEAVPKGAATGVETAAKWTVIYVALQVAHDLIPVATSIPALKWLEVVTEALKAAISKG